MLLCLYLLQLILEFNFLLIQRKKLIADELFLTLDLRFDLRIRDLDRVTLDESVATHSNDLLVSLHPIVVIEQFHHRVVLPIILLGQLYGT